MSLPSSRPNGPRLTDPRLLALVAGAVSALGFAPLHIWPATLAAYALLLHLLAAASGRRGAFAIGWLFGLGQFVVGLNWIAMAFTFQAAMPAWLGWVAVVLLSLYLAVYPGLAALGATWIAGPPVAAPVAADRRRTVLILALAGGWAITEWIRAWVITGFAWNPLGVVAVDAGWAARLVGTYGLGALLILVAGWLWLVASGRRAMALRFAAAPLAAAVLTLAGAIQHAPPPARIAIRVVQPNINQADKWDPAVRARNFARLVQQTRSLAPHPPRLVFWPEAAIPDFLEDGYPARYYFPGNAAGNRARVVRLIGPNDLLITGGVKLDFDRRGNPVAAANSVFALDPAGRIRGSYDKSHLVPFGEYLPYEAVLSRIGLSRLVPGTLGFTPGPGPRNIAIGRFGTMGLQICYEMIFSGHVVDPGQRPDFLFNPSNDAWFGAWGPPQHLAQARLRALEEGLPVIRSTPTGISAVIDADGRVLASVPYHRAGHIDARLPRPIAPTPFARLGNWLAIGFAGLLLLLAVALRRRGR